MRQDETIAVINDMCGEVAKRVLKSQSHFPAHWGPDHVRACVWLSVNRHFMDLRKPIREIRKSPNYHLLSI